MANIAGWILVSDIELVDLINQHFQEVPHGMLTSKLALFLCLDKQSQLASPCLMIISVPSYPDMASMLLFTVLTIDFHLDFLKGYRTYCRANYLSYLKF